MDIRNCTPHALSIITSEGTRDMAPSGIVPRVVTVTEPGAPVDGIPVALTRLGAVEGLPEPEPGVALVVSQIVAAALPHRDDLLYPGELVRDEAGRPVGCRGLARRAS